MPPIATDKVPNFPLNGKELMQYILNVFGGVITSRDVLDVAEIEMAYTSLETALRNDFVFLEQFAYPNVSVDIACQFHLLRETAGRFAFTIEPTIHMPNNPLYPKHQAFVRRPIGIPAPPIEGYPDNAQHVIDCFTVSAKVENPNLVRVHNAIPVVLRSKTPPEQMTVDLPDGQKTVLPSMFARIEKTEVLADPSEYPPLPEPVIVEQTEEYAKKWGLEMRQLAVVESDESYEASEALLSDHQRLPIAVRESFDPPVATKKNRKSDSR